MGSVRGLVGAASLCVIAAWSACGGVADPGPLSDTNGLDPDGDAGGVSVAGEGSGASGGDASGSGGDAAATGGAAASGGAGNGEGMDPDIGLENGGSENGAGGTAGAGGGTEAEAGSGGTEATGGSGGTEAEGGSGGSEVVGTGGTEVIGTGGTEVIGTGGTEAEGGSGGDDGAGGTEVVGTGGTEVVGTGGTEVVGQGGATEPPPVVDVEIGDCQDFVACGGELEGTWTYTGACIDLADLGLAEDDIAELCAGAELSIEGQVSGTLSFDDGLVTRRGTSIARGEVFVPALCAVPIGGCDDVEDELEVAGLAGATCTPQGLFSLSCNCVFEIEAPELDAVAFITDGDVLSLSDGRDFQYCVDGDDLTYLEIGGLTEPGVRELQR